MSSQESLTARAVPATGANERLSPRRPLGGLSHLLRSVPLPPGALCLLVLATIVLFSFRDAIVGGRIAFEADTLRFYYPLEVWFAEELRTGRFPLGNPYIFAGYPIFADGELGLAYPLHLVLAKLLAADQAFIALRISTALVAAVSLFALARSLGLGLLPSILGGMTFSLSSFLGAQQHHEDMTRSVAWAPLALACIHWAFQRSGWARQLWLTGAGAAVAMSALGLHPQGLALTLMVVGSFVVFCGLWGPTAHPEQKGRGLEGFTALLPRLLKRVGLTLWAGTYVVGLGLGIAGVQLVPLIEIATATYRASQPDYSFATNYALPVHNLVTLVLPYFFRSADGQWWSLWSQWETTVYVGIVPLVLGLTGAILVRRREVVYFLALAASGLWLAFASYAPVDIYRLLWELPGFSGLRAPGRYTFLFVLAWSVLAAWGLHALEERHGALARPRMLKVAALAVGAVGAISAISYGMVLVRSTLLADPDGTLRGIREAYLSLPHHEEGLEAEAVYRGLLHSLDPLTPRTAFAVLMLASGGLLVAGSWIRWPSARAWPLALIAAVALDLLAFGTGLHQKMPIDQLSKPTPAIQFLASNSGAWRVFSPLPVPSVEPDRLVPFRVEELGGYSSLESRQNFVYWSQLTGSQNELLDLANVRYVLYPARPARLPSHRGVPFDPERPLMVGSKGSPGGTEVYAFRGERAHTVRVVAALTHAFEVPQDAPVVEIAVVPREGTPALVTLRAGIDLAEWAYDRPDALGKVQHTKPESIAFRRPDIDPIWGTGQLYFFHSEHDLPTAMEVERVEIRYTYPVGGIELYGLGLYNADTFQTAGTVQPMRSKFRSVYRDRDVEIVENTAFFPRAYVVPQAVAAPGSAEDLRVLLSTPWDPSRQVLLQGPGAERWANASGLPADEAPADEIDPVQTLLQGGDRVIYRAIAPTGGFLVHVVNFVPGWRAWVDGREAPVLRANSLFQAVPLLPGEHTVELRYEPQAVKLGLLISLTAVGVALAVVAGALMSRWNRRARLVREALRRFDARFFRRHDHGRD